MRLVRCLFLCVLLFPAFSFAGPKEDPVDEINQQMAFVDQTMRDIEQKRAEIESQKKAEAVRRRILEKNRTEARLAVQLKGLSGTLSGLPEMPNFSGQFQGTSDSTSQAEKK